MAEFQHTNIPELSLISYKNLIADLENLANEIGKTLINYKETVSVAESVSAGLLQLTFSQAKNASDFFEGGITVYTLKQKVVHLNVDENEAQEFDCVSPHIAETMALNVSKMFQSQWSVAVTGYATPVPESDQKLFAFFSITYNEKVVCTEKLDLHPRTKPLNAQLYYSEFILKCLKNEIDRQKEKQ
ncbi:MAG: nicotinamide-nucleotide amidohydrolase family protein [Chryseobacterium sp.]|jgi:PncC family amidohydrolase|nr:nicotinamide-nucleotide amidohydrolase family protein [Chryseobacterium sp.]